MKQFKPRDGNLYTIDTRGIALINKEKVCSFITYPEAAVWMILNRNYPEQKTISMLSSIIGMNEKATDDFIDSCLQKWRTGYLIE
jgi:hypothetical protein